jgi:hypothetical protein
MVINKLNILRPLGRPNKAEPELIVDADAVLASAVPFRYPEYPLLRFPMAAPA